MLQSRQIALDEQRFFIEGVACAHFEPKGFLVEFHFAPAEEQNVNSFVNALPILIKCLALHKEVNATVLDQVLARRLPQAEQNRVVRFNLADALLSLHDVALLDIGRVKLGVVSQFFVILHILCRLDLVRLQVVAGLAIGVAARAQG